MRDTSLKGTNSVYKFTLIQLLKSKGSIATIILMLLMSFVVMPIASLIVGNDNSSEETVYFNNVESIYFVNETPLPLDVSSLLLNKFGNSEIINTVPNEELGDNDILITVSFDTSYKVDIEYSDATSLHSAEAEHASGIVTSHIYDTIYKMNGVSDEILSEFQKGININYDDAEYFYSADKKNSYFTLQYIYSILLMMFSMMSAGYIVRMVIEEKSSKLVELLMVSVKPLALIVGKILAISTYIFGTIALMVLSFILSSEFTKNVRSFSFDDFVSLLGASETKFDASAVIVIVLSFVIAYMTISILAGIMGTSCSSTEDTQSSTLSVTMIVMTGYIISCFAAAFEGAMAYVTSLLPIVSAFCAPVNYLLGKIPIWVVLISFIIQIAVLVLLSALCAKVYRELIVYNGKRMKFFDVVKMAKKKEVQ